MTDIEKQVIKDFVDMMEYKWSDYHELIKTPQFQALKSSISPVSESIKPFPMPDKSTIADIEEEIQATRDSCGISDAMLGKQPTNTQDNDKLSDIEELEYKIIALESELESTVESILNATDLRKLKELTIRNFPHAKEKIVQNNNEYIPVQYKLYPECAAYSLKPPLGCDYCPFCKVKEEQASDGYKQRAIRDTFQSAITEESRMDG